MKRRGVFFIFLCLILTVTMLFPVSAEAQPSGKQIFDGADLLDEGEEERLNALAGVQSEASDCTFYVATYRVPSGGNSRYDRYEGEDFLRDRGLSDDDNIVLLVLTLDRGVYYYDLYLYGKAWDRINTKEADYLLDHEAVYDNLKGGLLELGLTAFLQLSAKAYVGRLGVSYAVIITVCLLISLLIAFFVCFGVYQSYKAKKKSVDYPLDQFAKLKLIDHSDVFAGSFVTRRVIQSSSGGGRGGGSSHGGGRGHAGGR